MVLCGGTKHGRSSDIDILNTGLEIMTLRHGLLERIEIDHDGVDVLHVVLLHFLLMYLVTSHSQDTTMNLGMKCLDSSVQNLR